jgi:beta-lactamase superfamily II metal-dependent hydrolase
MKTMMLSLTMMFFLVTVLSAARTLDIYVVDTEGGNATLIVTPAGQSMLLDAGWRGPTNQKFQVIRPGDRDTNRIIEAVKAAGLKQIDYLVVTHYDEDHVGNVAQFVAKSPVRVVTFVDHGPLLSKSKDAVANFDAYVAVRDKAKHIVAKPGDTIAMKGLLVQVVTSAEEVVKSAFAGGGVPNQFCPAAPKRPPEHGENQASVGLLFTYGKFRMLDLADFLGEGIEYALMCPNNPIGPVDLFMTCAHAWQGSNASYLVHALHPRVAITRNGAIKGGDPVVYKTVRSSPGLDDVWQSHYALNNGADGNPPENFVANMKDGSGDEVDEGKWIKVSASADGTFTVTNARNGFTKTYKRRN